MRMRQLKLRGVELDDEQLTRQIDGDFPFPAPGDKLSGWPAWMQGIESVGCPLCSQPMAVIFQIESRLDLRVGRQRLPDAAGNGRARGIVTFLASPVRGGSGAASRSGARGFLLPLKALSPHREARPLVAALSRIQRGSAAFDYSPPRPDVRADSTRSNAFQEDLRNYKLVFP